MDEESFGQALRRLRGSRSVRDVAKLANCSKSYVSDLENGRRFPTQQLAAALDRALGAGGELRAMAVMRPNSHPLERATALQQGLSGLLEAGPMTDASLEDWEYTVARYGRSSRHQPEAELLSELVGDFADLQRLLVHRHPAAVRRRLTLAVVHMSGLMALTLLKLGDVRARDWWRTGRAAAGAIEDRAALSWVYAHEAYQLYYDGNMYGALELAERAQYLSGGLPCVGPALAAPLEARAHAFLGHHEQSVAALKRAETALNRLDSMERVDSALGYSESQLRFHSGNAWTHLAQTDRAREEFARALDLYPADDHTDRALIGLDEAVCLAADGDLTAAAQHATVILTALPVSHRSALITSRATELVDKVPEARRQLPEVRELCHVLELPSGGKKG